MNERVKKFSIFDVKLVQYTAIFFALIIVELIPQIMKISIWWFVALLVICAINRFMFFTLKNSNFCAITTHSAMMYYEQW